MIKWKMNKHCRYKGRTMFTAHQIDKPGGLALYPGVKFNAALRFIRKYAHIDVDKVLSGEQELPD